MWISGNGTWPKNALRASHSRTVLSLPIDHSMQRFLKAGYASRRMWTLRCSSSSRWFMPQSAPSVVVVESEDEAVDPQRGAVVTQGGRSVLGFARESEHAIAGRGVPLHQRRESRVHIGSPVGQPAELERAADLEAGRDRQRRQVALQLRAGMRPAFDHAKGLARTWRNRAEPFHRAVAFLPVCAEAGGREVQIGRASC